MSQNSSPASIAASPLHDILLVARFERLDPDFQFEATSLPGHLLQFVVAGEVWQECNGREYELRKGSLIWYHEDELVRGKVRHVPWVFYSVNFIAPLLMPPTFESRLYVGRSSLQPFFEDLLQAWQDSRQQPLARQFRAHAALLRILAALVTPERRPYRTDPKARLWWKLETELRKDLQRPVNMKLMTQLSKASPATIARSCQHAVGLPPLKRLKQVRLSLSRGLVLRSQLSMKQIAERAGYPRVHEFSRDYRKHFGYPPTSERNQRT